MLPLVPGRTRPALPAVVTRGLAGVVGGDRVMTDPAELSVFETDGFTLARSRPGAVVFCETVGEVAAVVRLLAGHGVPVVPRGSGTGLTGGCVAFDSAAGTPGVVVSVSRMRRVREVRLIDRLAHVDAGVRNAQLSDAVAAVPGGGKFHFAPDPSSERASTVGGNAATNAGGIHVLKDFVTSSHVVGVEMVTPDGDVVELGGPCGDATGVDLVGLACGSEGTLGIITGLWVRLSPKRPAFRTVVATFASQRDACDAVSGVVASGVEPAAMEMLDGRMVRVVERVFKLGIDPAAAAMLLVELDGPPATIDLEKDAVVAVFRRHGAVTLETADDPRRKNELWAARKKAFGAIGRISPSYCTQDACVPRSRLAEVLETVDAIGRRHGLTINNVFHAGDGNVHPIFLYDDRDPAQVERAMAAAEEVLKACVDLGGTITGEHGVGVEKLALMPYLFDARTLAAFADVKAAFDPDARLNAGKLLPAGATAPRPASPGRRVPQ